MGMTENISAAMNRAAKLAVVLVAAVLIAAACGTEDQTTLTQTPGERFAPDLLVRHGDRQEWGAAVYLDEATRAGLVDLFTATVDGFEAAVEAGYRRGDPLDTDPAELDAVDLEENFIVTDSYYCGDGDLRLEVTPNALFIHGDNTTSCESPRPVSSIWVVPRSAVSGSFTVGEPGTENPWSSTVGSSTIGSSSGNRSENSRPKGHRSRLNRSCSSTTSRAAPNSPARCTSTKPVGPN